MTYKIVGGNHLKFIKTMMFKYIRFFILGFAAFLLVETCVLLYLNNVYFKHGSDYTLVKINSTASSKPVFTDVKLTTGANNLSCSHDGKYLAYALNGQLNILDMTNNETYTVENAKGMVLSDFKWVYDRDRLMITEKNTDGKNGYYIKLYRYDIKDKILTEIVDFLSGNDYKINLSNKSDEVTDIEVSTKTAVTYVTVSDKSSGSNKYKIYEINVTEPLKKISTYTKTIGNILCLKDKDILLYEENISGKIYREDTDSPISVSGNTSLKLLGFDNKENVYFAVIKDSKTSSIYYGDVVGKSFQNVKLDKAVDPSSIMVNYYGNVYINDKTNTAMIKVLPVDNVISATSSSVSSSKTSSSKASSTKTSSFNILSSQAELIIGTRYSGSIVAIYDIGFVTNDSGIIKHYEFK